MKQLRFLLYFYAATSLIALDYMSVYYDYQISDGEFIFYIHASFFNKQ